MQLSEEDVREFREIWRLEFHEEAAPQEARHRAMQLLELYTLLAGLPPPTPTAKPLPDRLSPAP